MKLTIEDGRALIQVSGIRFLRLKTEIGNRLGRLSKTGKYTIEFPASCIVLVDDLLDAESKKDDSVRRYLKKFEDHAQARESALRIIEDSSVNGVPDNWLQLLDPAQATAV